MTFSIVAFDPDTRSWGVAVASKCLAVGHAVPWGGAGRGAIATQALANLEYGPAGLDLLAEGASAADVVARLTDGDPLVGQRQVGVVDAQGRAANHTGPDCLDWAGGLTDGEISVQGNILAGPQVVEAMRDAYRGAAGEVFVRRLLRALEAGEAAGGDRRGRQSAAVSVWREDAAYGGGLDIAVDLRVDDDADPVAELGRLVDLHNLYFCRSEPDTMIELDEALAAEVRDRIVSLGYDVDGLGFERALEQWVGTENFEERHAHPGKIDPLVLDHLRRQAGGVPA
jgi:uncharacterized Ntn-hydrolase superfamily protein